jgi:hypothetical protein
MGDGPDRILPKVRAIFRRVPRPSSFRTAAVLLYSRTATRPSDRTAVCKGWGGTCQNWWGFAVPENRSCFHRSRLLPTGARSSMSKPPAFRAQNSLPAVLRCAGRMVALIPLDARLLRRGSTWKRSQWGPTGDSPKHSHIRRGRRSSPRRNRILLDNSGAVSALVRSSRGNHALAPGWVDPGLSRSTVDGTDSVATSNSAGQLRLSFGF